MSPDGHSWDEAAAGAEPFGEEALGDPAPGYDGTVEVRRIQKLYFPESVGAYPWDRHAQGRYRWQPGGGCLLGSARPSPDRHLLSKGCGDRGAGVSAVSWRAACPFGKH